MTLQGLLLQQIPSREFLGHLIVVQQRWLHQKSLIRLKNKTRQAMYMRHQLEKNFGELRHRKDFGLRKY